MTIRDNSWLKNKTLRNTLKPSPIPTIRTGLKLSILEGLFSNFQYITLSSSYLVGLCLAFGLSDFQIALFGSMNFLSQIFFFVNAYLLQHSIDRKKSVMVISAIIRVGWIIPAMLISFQDPTQFKSLFVVFLTAYFVLDKMMAHSWNSWMSDLVPTKIRGKYFGVRSGIVAVATVIFHFVISTTLDHFKSIKETNLGFTVVLTISVIFGIVTIFLFHRQTHFKMKENLIGQNFSFEVIRESFKEKSFKRRLILVSMIQFTIGMGVMFFPIYMLEVVKVSFTTYAFYQTIHLLIGILGYRFCGKIIDKFGSDRAIIYVSAGLIFSSIVWLFINENRLYLFFLDAALLGFFQNAFNLININVSLSNPKDKFGNYKIAFFASIVGLSYFCGSLLAGQISKFQTSEHFNREQLIFTIFLVSLFIRILTFAFSLKGISLTKLGKESLRMIK